MKSDHYPVTTHLQKKQKPPPLDGGGKEPGAEGGGTVAFWSRFSHIFPRRKRERRSFAGGECTQLFFTGKASFRFPGNAEDRRIQLRANQFAPPSGWKAAATLHSDFAARLSGKSRYKEPKVGFTPSDIGIEISSCKNKRFFFAYVRRVHLVGKIGFPPNPILLHCDLI